MAMDVVKPESTEVTADAKFSVAGAGQGESAGEAASVLSVVKAADNLNLPRVGSLAQCQENSQPGCTCAVQGQGGAALRANAYGGVSLSCLGEGCQLIANYEEQADMEYKPTFRYCASDISAGTGYDMALRDGQPR
ncbi:unnamed protein product [Amoebophrya sp. A120]|nr:unnamed protein product [Amoebophrya sp. A120]|eukprot:GSA120T00005081001.1